MENSQFSMKGKVRCRGSCRKKKKKKKKNC